MPRKNQYYGGIIGASPLDSNGALRPGVSNLGGISGDNPFEAPSLDLTFDGTASSATGDNHFDDVVLLLNGDSATITDQSANTGSNVSYGTAVSRSTTTVKYGSGSLDFNPSSNADGNGYITLTLPALTGDYTKEFWVKPRSSSPGLTYYTDGAYINANFPLILVNSSSQISFWQGNTQRIVGSTLSNTDWTHVAAVRSGTTITLYVNGTSVGTWDEGTVQSWSSGTLYIGRRHQGVQNYFGVDGYIDDIRITNGVARYTADFTPPSYKLPTTKEATALDKLATDIVSCTRSTTATFRGSNGLIQTAAVNTPRVEYDASGNPLGLLVEESRTNLLTKSSDMTHSDWTQYASVGVTGGQADPAGGTDAVTLTDNAATAGYLFQSTATGTAGATYTASIYVKKTASAASEFLLRVKGAGEPNYSCKVDTLNGVVSGATAKIEEVNSDWWRVSVSTTLSGNVAVNMSIFPAHADGYNTGFDGTAQGSHIVYGPQIEQGDAATSYIPTDTTTETRAADDITMATSSFGVDKVYGTALVDATVASKSSSLYPGVYDFSAGIYKRNLFTYIDTTLDWLVSQFSETNATNNLVASGVTYPLNITLAQRRDGTTGGGALDGTLVSSVAIDTAVTAPTLLSLGRQANDVMNGHIRRFIYWPRAISDTSLIAYTGTNPPTTDIDRPTRRWGGMTGRSLVSLVDSKEDWTPADITSATVVGWFDGENVNGGSAGNSGATVWVNKAGGANLNFNGSPSPAVGTNNVRTASSAYLSEAGTPSFLQTSDWRVFIAATIQGGSGSDQYSPLFSSDTGSTNTGAFIYWKTQAQEFASYPNNTSSGTSTYWGFIDPIAPTYRSGSSSNFQGSPAVIDFKVSNNSPWEIAFDGGRSVSVVSQTITTQIPSNEAAHFGYSTTSTRRHDASYYQIVIVHGTLSSDDEARLYSYLAHKAGSQSYLQTSAHSSAAPKRVVPGVPTTGVLSLAEHYQTKL